MSVGIKEIKVKRKTKRFSTARELVGYMENRRKIPDPDGKRVWEISFVTAFASLPPNVTLICETTRKGYASLEDLHREFPSLMVEEEREVTLKPKGRDYFLARIGYTFVHVSGAKWLLDAVNCSVKATALFMKLSDGDTYTVVRPFTIEDFTREFMIGDEV